MAAVSKDSRPANRAVLSMKRQILYAVLALVGVMMLLRPTQESLMMMETTMADAVPQEIVVSRPTLSTSTAASEQQQRNLLPQPSRGPAPLPMRIEEQTGKGTISESTTAATTSKDNINAQSKFAYVFMIGGVRPDQTTKYHGYLYDILVSAKILKDRGSINDVVVWVQMSKSTSSTALTEVENNWLSQYGVQVRYLAKNKDESMATLMMQKFKVLDMTEYQRILFIDADVIPLGNLDYLFDLSVSNVLKKNIIMPNEETAANGHFFLLEPVKGGWDQVQQIEHEARVRNFKEGIKWNRTTGWGHVIAPNDNWRSRMKSGDHLWSWYAAFLDQGT
jgi:hypothetical protein